VALGVSVATAVLTGALLVGDSVRGSLRDLAIERLGRIDFAIVSNGLFRAELADELARAGEFRESASLKTALPAMLLVGALQHDGDEGTRRAGDVTVVGITDTFWEVGSSGPQASLGEDGIALVDALARDLGVREGDEVILRLPLAGQQIPADTILGEKFDTMISRRLRVAAILPPAGLARFGLRPSQQLPRNAFVPLEVVQDMLDAQGKANAILIAGEAADAIPPANSIDQLRASLRPALEDFGLVFEAKTSAKGTAYVEITSEAMLLPAHLIEEAERIAGSDAQPIITYLANTIVVGERKIPYSTITGVTSTAELGPLLDESGEPIMLADDEIALNRWAADDLVAKVGDAVTITFYEPESAHGRPQEHAPQSFRLAAIVPLKSAEGEPTTAADPSLTPRLEGVTDQESINNWDLPFELTETIRPADEQYWDDYSTTPKAFVSYATAERLWKSRYGVVTSIRIPHSVLRTPHSAFQSQFTAALDPAQLGMTIEPVKEQALAASTGTTPFEGLFLGFSFFLIAAAIMLVVLLFRLGVEQRAAELGILLASGIGRRKVGWMLAAEAAGVSIVGAAVGASTGVLYAWLMTYGLRTLWVDAVATPFIDLHVTLRSLAIGFVAGVVVALITVILSLRRVVRVPARQLLAGVAVSRPPAGSTQSRWPAWIAIALAATAIGAAIGGASLSGQTQAITFMGAGAAALAAALVALWQLWRRSDRPSSARLSLLSLAGKTLERNPSRSILATSLIASASFLIVALSAFRLDTGGQGTGGFALVGESSLPIHFNLAIPEGRMELGISQAADKQLAQAQIFTFRVKDGDDASCLNLYKTRQPRVLGVPEEFLQHVKTVQPFAWANRGTAASATSPWLLLNESEAATSATTESSPIPVILDANTATYSLHLAGVGDTFSIENEFGQPVTLRVAALLANSIFQGVVLMSEENARALFPSTATPRFFLIGRSESAPPASEIANLLEDSLSDYGFYAEDARERLAGFLVVQNTYLTTFQMLGALGMLLGTVGLAVVELRSVVERRRELALMRATGFRRGRLGWLVLAENGALLATGLAIGVAAAVVALLPHLIDVRAGIPWGTLAAMLLVIAAVGIAAGALAVRAVAAVPLQAALKKD
jgi:ABC-type antimicrobial peptide transport system permease subunit